MTKDKCIRMKMCSNATVSTANSTMEAPRSAKKLADIFMIWCQQREERREKHICKSDSQICILVELEHASLKSGVMLWLVAAFGCQGHLYTDFLRRINLIRLMCQGHFPRKGWTKTAVTEYLNCYKRILIRTRN